MQYDKIILGVDPGTNHMGLGIIGIKNKTIDVVAMDVLNLQKVPDQHIKLKRIFDTVLRNIDEFYATELAIESPFFGKNVQSMLKLGRAQGVAIAAAMHRNLPVFEYAPRKVKQSITGKGNASKEQVAAMLKHLIRLDIPPDYLDITDALGVAVCHYFQNSGTSQAGSKSYGSWSAFVASNPGKVNL